MQYTGITKIGPWDLFQISEWEKQELKDMVAILPTLPPLNYENLNKRIGKLKEYPLKIPSSHYCYSFGCVHIVYGSYLGNNSLGHM